MMKMKMITIMQMAHKESENFGDDYEDGDGDGYDVNYKKKTYQTK